MSYQSQEESLISGNPIELYSFRRGITYWTYTSGNVSIFYGGKTYTSIYPIRRSDIEMSLNSLKNLVKVTVDRTNLFALTYVYIPMDGIVEAIIYRGHGTLSTNYVEYWKGYVYTVGFKGQDAIITLSPKSGNMKRSGLMRKFSRLCTYPVYSTRCTVAKGSYKVSGTVSSTTGLEVVATAFGIQDDDWLLGGTFEVTNYSRMITYHDKSEQKIKISHPIPGLASGDAFNSFAGCNHTCSVCKAKFSNAINYGGQEWLPNKNPFSGDSIES